MTKEQKLQIAWEQYVGCRHTLFKYGGKKFNAVWVAKEKVFWNAYHETRRKINSGEI